MISQISDLTLSLKVASTEVFRTRYHSQLICDNVWSLILHTIKLVEIKMTLKVGIH